MKTTLIVLCCAVILASGCATSHSHSTAWDYKIVEGSVHSAIEKELKQLGSDGWVVVSSTSPAPYSSNPPTILVILKRQK